MPITEKANPAIARAIQKWNRRFPEFPICVAWGLTAAFREQFADEIEHMENVGGGLIQFLEHDFELFFGRTSEARESGYDDSGYMLYRQIKPALPLITDQDWKTAALAHQQSFDAKLCIVDDTIIAVRSVLMPMAGLTWHSLGCGLKDLLNARKWLLEEWQMPCA